MLGYRRFRRLLFRTFVACFLVTATLVLFYAFGYRYNFDRGIFVYSGSITLNTTPETVAVTIDGATLPEQKLGLLNNSLHLAGLMPGEHSIEVSAPGYQSWSKRAIVRSGVSTEFWNVLLPREVFVPQTYVDTAGVVKAFPQPGGPGLALVKQTDSHASIVILDRLTGTRRETFSSATLRFDPEYPEDVEWSPDGNQLLLPLFARSGEFRPVIVDRDTGTTMLLPDLLALPALHQARWDESEREAFFVLAGETLYRFAPERNQPIIRLADDVAAYDVAGDLVFVARSDGSVASFRQDTDATALTSIAPALPRGETLRDFSLIAYDEDRLAILEETGKRRLLLFNRGDKKNYGFQELGSNAAGLQFSDDGKKLLFFSNNELSAYFTRNWEVQPERDENSLTQIARFSDPIGSVAWTEDYEHVIFHQGATVKMIELDSRDRRVLNDILSLPGAPAQILPLYGDNLLFFVVPGQDLSSITFPEPQGLFGE